ncbi:MAG TPA: sialidase family protein [Candidatus Paceibacterota bacterium]|nr:sialidase family protein [Candidatus Paceibacterota bacterium]
MKKFGKIAAALIAVGGVALLSIQLTRDSTSINPIVSSEIFVGGDLHTLTVAGSQIVVTGHESAAISTDGGSNWKALKTLAGADVMGWASGTNTVFAGGHIGLFRSQGNNDDFARVKFYEGLSDVHSVGASGQFVYLASPDIGLMASVDDGKTWTLRNSQMGKGFMGSILVDSKNPMKILAADMQQGSLSSMDGGKSWKSLGGPDGPMAMAWNPSNNSEIVVIGMTGAGMSLDGGKTWSSIAVPSGAAAISFSKNGKRIYAASLQAPFARIFISSDRGKSWSPLKAASNSLNSDVAADQPTSDMDPNMPGMDHSASSDEHNEEPKRPLAAVLGVFGLASSVVISTAGVLKRKDRVAREKKLAQRKTRGDQK